MSEPSVSESRIVLPVNVQEPFEVYLNGIRQQPGVDFQLVARELVFPRVLVPEIKMTPLQWFLVAVGIGSYAKYDSVDITYEHEGRRLVATGLRPRGPAS